jgi:proton-dependent oligopeptide transporter, POT family
VIVDPNLTITRIYNLFYWCINVGSLSSIATTESERLVGFWLAYAIPTAVFILTPIVLIVSRNWYYKVPPKGSIVVEVWRCTKVALGESGWWRSPWKVGKEEGGVWKYAKPSYYMQKESTFESSQKSQKRFGFITWDDVFVDEVKRTLRACQIFLFYPVSEIPNKSNTPGDWADCFADSFIGSRIIKSPPTLCLKLLL